MIFKIYYKKSSIRDRIKRTLLYYSKRIGAKKAWHKRHANVTKRHPEYEKSVGNATEKKHSEIWSFLDKRVPLSTLRICGNISSIADPNIIPEEIFQTDIEPSLNRYDEGHIFANKSLYNHWFNCGLFPVNVLHSVDGELMDGNLNHLNEREVLHLIKGLTYPVVFKPNINSYGGEGVQFVEHMSTLQDLIQGEVNFVVQEKLKQHLLLEQFHKQSINTVRVYLYKSVTDNHTHILNIAQRMGNGSSIDNVTAGGLVSYITREGFLHGYALDKYGGRYEKHPISGVTFDQKVPDFDQLKEVSLYVAQKLFHIRVVGLDLFYDQSGRWRPLEINTRGHSIRFAQYAGQPFFGEFTEEVIEYCKENHWALTV